MNHPPESPEILVVDDEENMRFLLKEALSSQNFDVSLASRGRDALDMVRGADFDCIIMDVRMAGMNGLETLIEIKKIKPQVPVIMMTAFGSKKTALDCIQNGAYDYFSKPFDINEMRVVVKRALEKQSLEKENAILKEQLKVSGGVYDTIVGNSPAMREVFQLIDRIAPTDVTVLIQGESGTGKELVATVIHNNGPRHDKPLVKINCAAIPDTLLESELFGHEKGSFTGAGARKIGKFEFANQGTLFLDEIGDMSLMTQAKLLRVLEEHEIERLGGNETIHVDIRIIAATNQNLARLVQEKRFREDLFFRLNVLPIHLPSLRERKQDLPMLMDHFLKEACARYNAAVSRVSNDVIQIFMDYDWPGNVRELTNVIQRAVVMSQGDCISLDSLPAQMRAGVAETAPEHRDHIVFDGSLQDMIENIVTTAEKHLIEEALNRTDWSRTKTASMLKICRKSLHNKMKKYGLLDKDAELKPEEEE